MAIFGWISQTTGIPPFLLIAIALLLCFGLLALLLKASIGGPDVPSERQCNFIRANGTQCVKDAGDVAYYCEYHAAQQSIVEPVPVPTNRVRRSQCGFVREDGSKCKKLKPIEISRCSYHLKIENNAAK